MVLFIELVQQSTKEEQFKNYYYATLKELVDQVT